MPVNDWEGAYTLAFFRNLFDFFDLIIWIRLFVAYDEAMFASLLEAAGPLLFLDW